MLPDSRATILASLAETDLVLDVGGWAKPLDRADWVLDLMPFATRGLYAQAEHDRAAERFDASRWVERDICDRAPWPFADGQFDFAVCSHTLEDVRDPIWVCSELSRVARRGYVEVPSRLEEQSWGVHGPWVGWAHHRWLIDQAPGGLRFSFKSHAIHSDPRFHFAAGFATALTSRQRVEALFWEGRLVAEELVFTDAEAHDEYLSSFVDANGGRQPGGAPSSGSHLRRLAARLRSSRG